MRSVLAVAAFALILAVPAAWSQRGGGHGGGMGHSVGVSHAGGFGSSGVSVRSGATGAYHSGYHGCYTCGPGYSHTTYPYNPSHHYYVSYYGRYGYRYPYYGYGYGYYWPWWWDSSSYDDNSSDQNYAAARQIDDLSQQVQQLREQLAASQYAPPRYGPPAPESPQSEASPQSVRPTGKGPGRFNASPDLATVLVFRDQRIEEIENYAIVGKTLVVIADERQRKIPLADLDLDKTTKLNEERGVDFQLPR